MVGTLNGVCQRDQAALLRPSSSLVELDGRFLFADIKNLEKSF